MKQATHLILFIAVAAIVGCTGKDTKESKGNGRELLPTDTIYTPKAAMARLLSVSTNSTPSSLTNAPTTASACEATLPAAPVTSTSTALRRRATSLQPIPP